jgi:DNA-binding transcriptional regulator YhcF (GntR family)
LARWLLLSRDRLDDDTIPLTHDILAMMLGVRRAGITTALEQLERRGAVQKGRGAVDVVNRAHLEQAACECYRIIATEHQRLLDVARPARAPERDGNRTASPE